MACRGSSRRCLAPASINTNSLIERYRSKPHRLRHLPLALALAARSAGDWEGFFCSQNNENWYNTRLTARSAGLAFKVVLPLFIPKTEVAGIQFVGTFMARNLFACLANLA